MLRNPFKVITLSIIWLSLFSCSKENKPKENRPPGEIQIESIQYENQNFTVQWSTPSDPDGDLITYDVYIDNEKILSETINQSATGFLPYNSTHSGKIIATDSQGGNSEVSFTLEMPKSKILFFTAEDIFYALDVRTQQLLWKDQMNPLMRGLHSTIGDQIFIHYEKLQSKNILTGDVLWTKESNDEYESHFVMSDGEAIYRKINYDAFERLDPNDKGATQWSIDTYESKGPAGLDDLNIYLTDRSNPDLEVYDKITGEEKWTFTIPNELGNDYYNQIGHTPITSEDKVFFRSGLGYFFALSKDTGETIWYIQITNESISNYKGNETRPILFHNDIIVIANSEVFSINQNDGNLNWRLGTGSQIYSSPFLYENHIYFTSNEFLFCMDATRGSIKWKRTLPTHTQISPIVHDDIIYVGGDEYYYAFNVLDGSEIWRFKTGDYPYTSPTLVIGESEEIVYPSLNPSTN